jgi:DNA-binding SARP family transcriptional activator/tetratricopeptide (TPR) repeat protein
VEDVFRILGPVEVDGPAGTVRIPPGRQQVVLAFLLVEANKTVSTDHLVDALWDDQPPDTARTQVQICVSRLRKNLAAGGVTVAIETRPPGYVLKVPPERLDMHTFTSTVADARVLAREGRAADAAGRLRAAVALWRGPCLSGMSSRALRTRALRLDEERLTATEDYLELELGLGHHHPLIGEITRLVHENPLRERLRGLLMVALYRAGRQAEALDVYRAGRDLLIEELGLEPGPELRGLETAILSGAADLRYATGAVATTPPPPPPPAEPVQPRMEVPRQLPADTADFVGHDELVATAGSVLTAGDRAVGVVVIVGRPGVGKSTVATHIGHRVAATHFPDGQLYCDLRGTRAEPSAAADVLGRFLLALGIPGPMIPNELAGRIEMYRTLLAQRRVLVVLDDAVTEQQVVPLLPGSSNCAVLVTSRSRLTGVPGARRLELDVLDAEHSLDLIGRVIGTDRLDREREAAAALVRTVGGLPLALRIIAARLAARPHWTLASMVHRLASERHRLDELAHGEMTVRASLSLTHDGLDCQSRRLFGLLSLVEGPALPGWIAGAVLDDDHRYPSDLLEPLVDVQMLDVASVETTGEFRYRFQDMVRLFARERLAHESDPAEHAGAVERIVGGWLALAEEAHRRVYGGDYTVLHGAAPRWRPPADYCDQVLAEPLDWMASEQANLCAAVAQSARAGLDELSWDLAVTVATLCESRGYLADWEKTHADALTATRGAGNTRGTAALLGSLGTLYLTSGQTDRSGRSLTEALALFVELDEARGMGLCRRDLALLARYAGDEDAALDLYARAVTDFDRVGDVVGRATVLTQRAHILSLRDEVPRARADLAEAMEIYRGVGYEGGIAHTLRRIGQVQSRSGEHEEAARTLVGVLEMVRRSQDVIGEGHLLHNLGEIHVAAGRLDVARDYFEQALALRESFLDDRGAAAVRVDLAGVLARLGEPGRAGELLTRAASVFTDRGMDRERAAAEVALAGIPR